MEQITPITFDKARLFDLMDRLPETFNEHGWDRFAAMDADNTYVIETRVGQNDFYCEDGFLLRVISRHDLFYQEHRFDIAVEGNGIPLIHALRDFSEVLAGRERGDDSAVDLRPVKEAFKRAQSTTDFEPAPPATQEWASKVLTFALSYGGICGEVWIIWGRPIQVSTTDRTFDLPLSLSLRPAALKPQLTLTFDRGELRLMEDAMSVLNVPGRSIVCHMQAANELMALGLSEDEIGQLEKFAHSIRACS